MKYARQLCIMTSWFCTFDHFLLEATLLGASATTSHELV